LQADHANQVFQADRADFVAMTDQVLDLLTDVRVRAKPFVDFSGDIVGHAGIVVNIDG